MVGKEAPHHRPQPPSLLDRVLVPTSAQSLLDLLQLRRFPISSAMADQQKAPLFRPRADMGKAPELEDFWLAVPPGPPIGRGAPPELNQSGLLGVQFQG